MAMEQLFFNVTWAEMEADVVEVAEAMPVVAAVNLSRRMMLEDGVQGVLDLWRYQSRIPPPWRQILIALYTLMIVVGSVGNLMVIYAVARNPGMRTARNVFIVNLAISDLMLCLITMPLTLIEILYLTWQFGNIEVACRLIGLLQATSVFVSTISITAIALDRRRLIVGTEQESPEDMGKVVATIPIIWATAITMASPLAIWKTLENWTGWTSDLFVNDTETCPTPATVGAIGGVDNLDATAATATATVNEADISTTCLLQEIIVARLSELQTCKETFPEGGRTGYSFFVMLFQFLVPMITICWAYYQICQTLRLRLEQRARQRMDANHFNNRRRSSCAPTTATATATATAAATPLVTPTCASATATNANAVAQTHDRRSSVLRRNDERRERNILRLQKTIKLLCWIGAIFCICWLPLNILNAVTDTTDLFTDVSEEIFCCIYAVCHVLGMLSACANPVIYGFLNENFSKEFVAIGRWWLDAARWLCTVMPKSASASGGKSAGGGSNAANGAQAIIGASDTVLGSPATAAANASPPVGHNSVELHHHHHLRNGGATKTVANDETEQFAFGAASAV